jgi:hypothetical protein
MADISSAEAKNLKECFGSFPASHVECYDCRDEKKCYRMSMMKTQTQILGWIQAIDSTNRLLYSINDSIDEIKPMMEALQAHSDCVQKK